MIKFGIDRISDKFKNKKVSIICNIASVDFRLKHIVDVLLESGGKVVSILAPQHGFLMDKQDNMIESKHGVYKGIPVYSLYGETRIPEPYMFKEAEILLFDLQDVGSRYYTYIYTMYYAMEVCAELNIKFVVLDRPNPIGGKIIEGGLVEKDFFSFVGLYPLPNRHALTVAELANFFNKDIKCKFDFVKISHWKRSYDWTNTGRVWVMPSPNMPSYEASLVYTGMCLLEATNISEGRGTCRPFEFFGAPFINVEEFLNFPAIKNLEAVFFRPHSFMPTFNKFKEELCNGFQIHVTNKNLFNSYKTGLAIIYTLKKLYPNEFKYKNPPYEYEFNKMPVDILTGSSYFRDKVDEGRKDFSDIYENLVSSGKNFKKNIKDFYIY